VEWSVQLDDILAAAVKMGIQVRSEPLGGEGGGVCRVRGQTVLFLDTMADPATQFRRTLEAMADLPGLDQEYLRPELREQIDRIRAGGSA